MRIRRMRNYTGRRASPLMGGASVAQPPALLANLLAYWTLNESSGNRADSTGNGKTMVETGSVTGAAGFGNVGAVSVWPNNVANYLSLGSVLFSSGSWSIAGWLNLAAVGVAQQVFSQAQAGVGNRQFISVATTGRVNYSASGSNAQGTTVLTSGTWYLLVSTYDGTTIKGYVNAAASADASATQTASYTGDVIYLGRASGAAPLNGSLGGWGVYNKVLSNTEQVWLYNAGNGRAFNEFV